MDKNKAPLYLKNIDPNYLPASYYHIPNDKAGENKKQKLTMFKLIIRYAGRYRHAPTRTISQPIQPIDQSRENSRAMVHGTQTQVGAGSRQGYMSCKEGLPGFQRGAG